MNDVCGSGEAELFSDGYHGNQESTNRMPTAEPALAKPGPVPAHLSGFHRREFPSTYLQIHVVDF